MTRHITPHKGGRTARSPEARIRPQTLQRIRATMQERRASFADLLEEQYSTGDDTMKQIMEYNNDTESWEPLGASYSGMSDGDAKAALKQLRKWAKDDNSGKQYKARDVVIVPR
jgi:hypothetical protein